MFVELGISYVAVTGSPNPPESGEFRIRRHPRSHASTAGRVFALRRPTFPARLSLASRSRYDGA